METVDPPRLFQYRVDEDNKIIYVSREWEIFARENQSPHLSPAVVLGKSLFQFLAHDETRHLYQILLQRVRSNQQRVMFPFRCDGPALRRFMELEMSPWPGGQVQFESRMVREEPRDAVLLLDASVGRSEALLTICGWCKRVAVAGQWLEVEVVVRQLGLFQSPHLPKLTHGICNDCHERMQHETVDI